MTEKLYPTNLDPHELEPFYSQHMAAMTEEDLYSKSEIAEQLAWRDKRLAESTHATARLEACAGRGYVQESLPLGAKARMSCRPTKGDDP